MKTIDQHWADLISEPTERDRWRQHFGRNVTAASHFRDHFTDPARAAQWIDSDVGGFVAAYLDRHHVPNDEDTIEAAFTAAYREGPEHNGGEDTQRACLILAHPHLTRADRDAIMAAGLSLTEIDHLIATGTYHRDTVALMAGLHR